MNRLEELREKYRDGRDLSLTFNPRPATEYPVWTPPPREPFRIGDEVYVRCKVVGPSLLTYGYDCIVLDLVPLDSRDEESGGKFSVTPKEVFHPHELVPYA